MTVEKFWVNETVLIVDDNDIVRKLVCVYAEGAGYRVINAGSPVEALAKAGVSGAVDVVVTDVVMSDGGGIALVQSLRKLYPSVLALFMSGYDDACLTGSFIAKPFTSAEFLDALGLLLGRSRPGDREPARLGAQPVRGSSQTFSI